MLKIVKKVSVEKLHKRLSPAVLLKFAEALERKLTREWFGESIGAVLSKAVFEIAYMRECEADGIEKDGNWFEFTQWTGIDDATMQRVEDEMRAMGWTVQSSEF
jgi:hypothetical protein